MVIFGAKIQISYSKFWNIWIFALKIIKIAPLNYDGDFLRENSNIFKKIEKVFVLTFSDCILKKYYFMIMRSTCKKNVLDIIEKKSWREIFQ